MVDTRIAYGARCQWWDSIDKVGLTKARNPYAEDDDIRLPCCPHCGGMLFEYPDEESWWKDVDSFDAREWPGYRAFIEWRRGKCYPTQESAERAYALHTKETKSGENGQDR